VSYSPIISAIAITDLPRSRNPGSLVLHLLSLLEHSQSNSDESTEDQGSSRQCADQSVEVVSIPALSAVGISASELSAVAVGGEGNARSGSIGNGVVASASVDVGGVGTRWVLGVGDSLGNTSSVPKSGTSLGSYLGTTGLVALLAHSAVGLVGTGVVLVADGLLTVSDSGGTSGGINGCVGAGDGDVGIGGTVNDVEPVLAVTLSAVNNISGSVVVETTVELAVSDSLGVGGLAESVTIKNSGADGTGSPVEAGRASGSIVSVSHAVGLSKGRTLSGEDGADGQEGDDAGSEFHF